jgi:hypothetical protein
MIDSKLALALLVAAEACGVGSIAGATQTAARQQTTVRQTHSQESTVAMSPAVALTRVPLPNLGYEIALPEGWVTTPPLGFTVAATPAGRKTPLAYFAIGIPVSDLDFLTILNSCNQAVARNPLMAPDMTMCTVRAGQAQIADSQYRWSPSQAVEKLSQVLGRAAGSQMIGAPEFHAVSPNEALYRFRVSKNGGSFVQWGHAVMNYLPNPLLRGGPGGAPGVTSLLFATGCEAPAEQAADPQLVAACSAIAHSFRPGPEFAERLIGSLADNYQKEEQILIHMAYQSIWSSQQRSQMINQAMSTIRDLEWQTFDSEQRSQLKTGEGWINTYAGTQDFVNPQTGKEYNFNTQWQNYRYNCMSAGDRGYFSNQLNCAELGGKLGISLQSISPVE